MSAITAQPAGGISGDSRAFGIGLHVFLGVFLALLLLGGVGGWAATAQLTGAVIAQGSVVVDQNLKQIQHRDGGIVAQIMVREGDRVTEGQVLFRLEDAQTRAELSIVHSQLGELMVRRARLLAERDSLPAIEFPESLVGQDEEFAAIRLGERRLFEGNAHHRESQKQQLELGITQIGEEILGLESQRASKAREIELVEAEFGRIANLANRDLVESARVFSADRDRVRLHGELGEIDAAIARAKARIGEIRLQIISIDENARTDAQRELSTVEPRMSEMMDRATAIQDRLSRTEIRAPITGTINELRVHTEGGVITPAETLATIVPSDANLRIEARLAPVSIDQVKVGHEATLRFSSFNQRTTPELEGAVVHVSPATTRDNATGELYYMALIDVPGDELAKLGASELVPGMPVEVFVSTEERTAISYFVKPFTDQLTRAFRER
jgi:HlyD family type I secretion membrane fusion protein